MSLCGLKTAMTEQYANSTLNTHINTLITTLYSTSNSGTFLTLLPGSFFFVFKKNKKRPRKVQGKKENHIEIQNQYYLWKWAYVNTTTRYLIFAAYQTTFYLCDWATIYDCNYGKIWFWNGQSSK